MATRRLTEEEIHILESRGCQADDWTTVLVAKGFTPGRGFHQVQFSGEVTLGTYEGTIRTTDGFAFPAGINHSTLHNVTVGDNCLIRHVHASSTDIGDNVVLDRVEQISRLGFAPFANGLAANVLTEDGARSVPLWRHLTAQLAHLLCHLKKHPAAVALEEMVRRDADTLRLPRSRIASGSRIRRIGLLRNVWLGEGVSIEGAAVLENCYVDSAPGAPARLGEGVQAKECVFLRSCRVDGGAMLERCLVGEGVEIGSGFNVRNSLLFANSEFGLGEADAAMAGPFAVSLHKATLVLTCQCSFSTFGSGSNASNHHFKLGPRHGGVLRRGVKCGSGSYLFWPCDIGAFTTVVGRHKGHLDTGDFPFSLLLSEKGNSVLVPGVNLFSAGLYRDADKWRQRDRRGTVKEPLDLVNPAILSPYVFQAMDAGAEFLRRCIGIKVDVRHGGVTIPAGRIEPALRLYEAALAFHMGEKLFTRASAARSGGFPELGDLRREILAGEGKEEEAEGRWRDWGGMLLPGSAARKFLASLEAGELSSSPEVRRSLAEIHNAYDYFEWIWLAARWRREFGKPTDESLIGFTERWRRAVALRYECFIKDAGKEYAHEAQIGFGLEEDAGSAFRRIRGTLTDHPLAVAAEAEKERLLGLTQSIPHAEAADAPDQGM